MSGSGFAQFIPLILIFVIFYFFLIRPQQKKIKDHKLMVAALKRGDEVITSGGIVGTVQRILGDDKVDLQISENVTVQVIQSTIQSLLKTNEQKETTISKGPFKGSIITIASLPKKHRISVFVHILGKKRRITASLDDINA